MTQDRHNPPPRNKAKDCANPQPPKRKGGFLVSQEFLAAMAYNFDNTINRAKDWLRRWER